MNVKATKIQWVTLAVVVAIAVIAVTGLLWLRSARGFSASASPTWMETEMAEMARQMAMPTASSEMTDPLPVTAASIAMGSQHFAAHCALCHDNNGDGQTVLGKNLYPKPPDLRGLTQSRSDGEIFFIIRNGIRLSAMPAWPDDSAHEIWMLVQTVRHLPQLTPSEIAEMKKFNPQTIFPEPIM